MNRTVEISKVFDFDAAHWLPNVPEGHKCKRMHGHTYRVEVRVKGQLDHRGFVADYAELAEWMAPVIEALDHRTLNEVRGLDNPTTEVLVWWIWDQLRGLDGLCAVRVYESATTWAEAKPPCS